MLQSQRQRIADTLNRSASPDTVEPLGLMPFELNRRQAFAVP